MNFDYKGVIIPDEIIIVKNSRNQGYVVIPGKKDMLKNALCWAKNDSYLTDEEAFANKEKYMKTYKNGDFSFELKDSAGSSSQGGKLSFWNCLITAPDNESFLIGISSEVLLNLLKCNTFIDGKIQRQIYLGRVKGNNVGAFTENMEYFTQAQKDLAIKNKIEKTKTNKYVVGDIVSSLTEESMYCRFAYQYYRLDNYRAYGKNAADRVNTAYNSYYQNATCIVINDEPVKKFIFDEKYYPKILNTKPSKVIVDHKDFSGSPIDLALKAYFGNFYASIYNEYKKPIMFSESDNETITKDIIKRLNSNGLLEILTEDEFKEKRRTFGYDD